MFANPRSEFGLWPTISFFKKRKKKKEKKKLKPSVS